MTKRKNKKFPSKPQPVIDNNNSNNKTFGKKLEEYNIKKQREDNFNTIIYTAIGMICIGTMIAITWLVSHSLLEVIIVGILIELLFLIPIPNRLRT